MLRKPITPEQALSRLAALCAKGEHCTGELRDKLRLWDIAPADADSIIDHLVDQHFVDDSRFTRAFASDKIRYDHWGRRKIGQALFMKHVPSSVSAPILDAIPDEEYLAVLRPLLHAKWPTIHAATDYERSMKLIKFAIGRGFSLDLIRQCIDDVNNMEDIDDEG